MTARVLVFAGDEAIRETFKLKLEREGFDIGVVSEIDDIRGGFSGNGEVGVLVLDLPTPGKDAYALMGWVRDEYPLCRVVVTTSKGEKEMAVQAFRLGASDYMERPFDLDEFARAIAEYRMDYQREKDSQEKQAMLEARVQRSEGKVEDRFWYVSKSGAMAKVNDAITGLRREAMRGNVAEPPVLIYGESGTGKEGIARMVHAGSRRGKGPWVSVNCANFTEQHLETELFGEGATKRGLFDIAKGGTFFFDGVGEISMSLQAKIMRRIGAVTDSGADVRVIAATNYDLRERIRDGRFSADFYQYLSRAMIEVPALRERSEDIVPMARQFAERTFRERGKVFSGFTADAESGLGEYGWPGNMRELFNTIERTALIFDGVGQVAFKNLFIPASTASVNGVPKLELVKSPSDVGVDGGIGSYTELKKKWCDAFERDYLITTLNRHHGNVSAAARDAHLDRSNFLRLLRRHGLRAEMYRDGVKAAA
jgi:DNA-binding NtrC family response regulator